MLAGEILSSLIWWKEIIRWLAFDDYSVPQSLAALDLLTCKQTADGADANQHEVGEPLHKEFRHGLMHPGIDCCFGHRKDSAGRKNITDDPEYELKIRHDTLPFPGVMTWEC
jgi:hypothetical protein